MQISEAAKAIHAISAELANIGDDELTYSEMKSLVSALVTLCFMVESLIRRGRTKQ